MTRSRLPFAVALVAAAALVLAAAAAPSRTARHRLGQQATSHGLVVWPFDSRLNAPNADTGIEIIVPESQSAAKVVVYVPAGYSIDLALPPGTAIGTAVASATTSAGAVTLRGTIVADSPTRYAADPASIACAGAAPHSTVWLLQVAAGPTSITVPVFVDVASGVDGGLGVFKLQFCLPPPDVPASPGGVPSGLRITDLFAEITRGVTNPPIPAEFLWRALVTPFVPGTATQNTAGTDEARSIVVLPQVLTLKGRYDRKTKSILLTGSMTLSGAKAGAGVDVYVFGSTKPTLNTFKRLAQVKTKKGTVYTHRRKATKTMYFVTVVDEYFYRARCDTGPSAAPAGCVQESLPLEAVSRLVTVKVPKPKK
jgi:hypothetical protein